MEVVFSNVLEDLNNFQSKIASLFQDLMKEKVYYKENLEHLCKNLKETSTETQRLKKEIKVLKEDNINMRSIISRGNNFFKTLNFSKTSKQLINELEELRTIFLEYSTKMENTCLTDTVPNRKKQEVCTERYELDKEEIQEEIKLLKNINFCNNLFNDDKTEKDTIKEGVLQRNSSEKSYKACEGVEENDEEVQNINEVTRESALVHRTKSYDSDFINTTVCSEFVKPGEQFNKNNKSPVFKGCSGRRNYVALITDEEDESRRESRSSGLFNEKFLAKTNNSGVNSPENISRADKSSQTPESPSRKVINKTFKIPNFSKPANDMLKNSYKREVHKSPAGLKILTQTFLNVERFKRKTREQNKASECEENENIEKLNNTSEDEVEETIIDVPDKVDRILKDTKNKETSGHDVEEIPFMTPPCLTQPDLDETYLSSSIIRKHVLERQIDDQTPLKRPAPESPEKDFPYKDKPVRKKAERMKLPGHACVDCNKYYENALGDIDSQERKKILNKCSRHRDRYSPSADDTPRDYWKPYLTSSTMISPNS